MGAEDEAAAEAQLDSALDALLDAERVADGLDGENEWDGNDCDSYYDDSHDDDEEHEEDNYTPADADADADADTDVGDMCSSRKRKLDGDFDNGLLNHIHSKWAHIMSVPSSAALFDKQHLSSSQESTTNHSNSPLNFSRVRETELTEQQLKEQFPLYYAARSRCLNVELLPGHM